MAYRYDTKTDTLYIFQEYRGIHGTDKKEGLSQDELEKLDAMVNKEQVYFFSDLFAEYNRTKCWSGRRRLLIRPIVKTWKLKWVVKRLIRVSRI